MNLSKFTLEWTSVTIQHESLPWVCSGLKIERSRMNLQSEDVLEGLELLLPQSPRLVNQPGQIR
jgi:hypothetical protein